MNIKENETVSSRFQMPRTSDVVVIDDDESMCEGCRQTLEEEGYRAAVALDGKQGLSLVKALHPKVIIVDIRMPGMNGIEVIGKISEIDPGVVSIVITGYSSIYSGIEVKKVGAFDFLEKPFSPERILESVKRGMKLRQLKEKSKAVEKTPSPSEMTPKAASDKRETRFGIVQVLERACYDDQFIAQLIERGSDALQDYDLTGEEKAALLSGDIRWIVNRVGKLTETQMRWFKYRIQQEKRKISE